MAPRWHPDGPTKASLQKSPRVHPRMEKEKDEDGPCPPPLASRGEGGGEAVPCARSRFSRTRYCLSWSFQKARRRRDLRAHTKHEEEHDEEEPCPPPFLYDRNTGSQKHRTTKTQDHRNTGPQKHKITEFQDHRNAGPQKRRTNVAIRIVLRP